MSETPVLEWSILMVVGRAILGWSQEDLAANADVSLSSITRLEAGGIPTPAMREKVERALGLEGWASGLERLLGGLRVVMRSKRGLPPGVDEAAAMVALFTGTTLGAALAEVQEQKEERGTGTAEPVVRPLGLAELRKERLERRLRRERLRGAPET